jgi:formylglycine-generating enzyme required for sulfatase activity
MGDLPFEPETVLIPAGPFLMGSTPGQIAAIKDETARERAELFEQPQHTIALPDYQIGKYPVTVGEYRPFVEAGGYREEKWWTTAGWQWRNHENIIQPDYWDNPKWTGDNRLPVIGVCWYEATAYCGWLAETTGKPYRLPGEAEWEKAARGTDGRIYPWGDEWQDGRCNSKEAQIGHTTLVGRFSPAGDSPYGAADMSGNVWEWCASGWADRHIFPEDNTPDGDARRVLRGSAWGGSQSYVRAAYRFLNLPSLRLCNSGFRVIRSPSQ